MTASAASPKAEVAQSNPPTDAIAASPKTDGPAVPPQASQVSLASSVATSNVTTIQTPNLNLIQNLGIRINAGKELALKGQSLSRGAKAIGGGLQVFTKL